MAAPRMVLQERIELSASPLPIRCAPPKPLKLQGVAFAFVRVCSPLVTKNLGHIWGDDTIKADFDNGELQVARAPPASLYRPDARRLRKAGVALEGARDQRRLGDRTFAACASKRHRPNDRHHPPHDIRFDDTAAASGHLCATRWRSSRRALRVTLSSALSSRPRNRGGGMSVKRRTNATGRSLAAKDRAVHRSVGRSKMGILRFGFVGELRMARGLWQRSQSGRPHYRRALASW
jgi:hypothetical protein